MSDTRLRKLLRSAPRDRPVPVWVLLALLVGLGVRGLLGGGQFLLDPSGGVIGLTPAVLAGTPLDDFTLPGLILVTVFGVCPLIAAERLWRGASVGRLGGTVLGVALVAWVIVEGFVLGFGQRLQVPNLLYGIATAALARSPTVRSFVDEDAPSEE